jgi:hypothetical protein
MADDIGWFNLAHNMGIMGYRTPNIDRIGKEGQASLIFPVSKVALQEEQHLVQGNRLYVQGSQK